MPKMSKKQRADLAAKQPRQPPDPCTAALAYATRGWCIVPLRPRAKGPWLKEWQKKATTDPAQIQTWFAHRPDSGVGILTGKQSGLVVLDIDGATGDQELAALLGAPPPLTYTVRTGGAGERRHRYYAHPLDGPDVPSFTGDHPFRPGLEVKADGGHQVVGPPSIHPNTGTAYTVECDLPVAPLPLALLEAIRTQAASSRNGKGAPPVSAPPVSARSISKGGRNDHLTRRAGQLLRAGFLTELIVTDALLAVNEEECDPPLPAKEVRDIAEGVVKRYAGEHAAEDSQPVVRTLSEIIADPDFAQEPEVLAQNFAWRGRVTMLAAREKFGKTTLAAYVAACVSAGRGVFHSAQEPGTVLWCGLEGHVADVASHLVTFECDTTRILVTTHLADALVSLRHVVEGTRPDLVVVDTLFSLAASQVKDAQDSPGWTRVMNALGAITRDFNCALLFTHHGKKSDGKYRDSTAIGAGVDMILEMIEQEKQAANTRYIETRGRWTLAPFWVRLEDEARFVLASPELPLVERVYHHIKLHPGCSKERVRKAVAGTSTDKDNAMAELIANGRVTNSGSATAYKLHAVKGAPSPAPSPSTEDEEL